MSWNTGNETPKYLWNRLVVIAVCFLVVLTFFLHSSTVSAGGMLNVEDSWLISNSITHQLLTGDRKSQVKGREYLLTIAQGRLYAMKELEQRCLAFEGVVTQWGKCISLKGQWQQTGKDLFVEDRLATEILMGEHPALGILFTRIRQTLGQVEQQPQSDVFIKVQTPFQWGAVQGLLQLQWPAFSTESNASISEFGRREEVFKATLVHSQAAFAVVVDRLSNGKPNFGFQMLMTLASGTGLEFRVDLPTGSIGPCLTILRGSVMLRTSHVVHPQLGVTHRLALVLGRFGTASANE